MLGIIGGTSLLFSTLPSLEKPDGEHTFGSAEILKGDIVMLMRHQHGLPPHRINHRAHLAALAITAFARIVAFGSSGSLKPKIAPGSLLIPTDYICLSDTPSIHDHDIDISHRNSPGIFHKNFQNWSLPHALAGYMSRHGPRIETVAEVNALGWVADVVGMTVASEATLAGELGMEFAALCTVDNYANGLGREVHNL